jgi:hypothetical protein
MQTQSSPTRERISMWSHVRINLGVFCIGALGCYAFIMFSSARLTHKHPEVNPVFSSEPPSARATIIGRMTSESQQIESPQAGVSELIKIDRTQYCQQVATAVLLRFNHKITDDEIIFMRNPRLSGSAIQQFAIAFGYAIETGMSQEVPEADR